MGLRRTGTPRHGYSLTRICAGAVALLAAVLFGTGAIVPASAQTAPGPSAGTTASPGTGGTSEVKPVRSVVLVDESGSLSPDDVNKEKDAARKLVNAQLSPRSTIAVIGFASADAPGQVAVDRVCPETDVSNAANQKFLSDCIGQLRPRTANEGNNTDHVAALDEALATFRQSPGDSPKIVFLLTDGKLDVPATLRYGNDPEERNETAAHLLTDAIARARADEVQIWPLGFGSKNGSSSIDGAALDRFAQGGYQGSCSRLDTAKPHKEVVNDLNEVKGAVLQMYALASCSYYDDLPPIAPISDGQTREVAVEIPKISTDGSIVVTKVDPAVEVSYFDPNNAKVPDSGTVNRSTFTRSTKNSTVESLRIRNPKPGTWKVVLKAPEGAPSLPIDVDVIWQGRLRATVVPSTQQPEAGREITLAMQLQNRDGPIRGFAGVNGLVFGVNVTGDSVPASRLPLTDNGTAGDAVAGDGIFSALYRVPSTATGCLTFLGTVDGPGIAGDERPVSACIRSGSAPVAADITVDTSSAEPGKVVKGRVVVTTTDAKARTLLLHLTDIDAGTIISIAPDRIQTRSSGTTEVELTLALDARTEEGPASATINLVDADDPTSVIASYPVSMEVRTPPPLVQRLWWLWVLLSLLVLAFLVVLWARWVASQKAQGVADLVMVLHRPKDVPFEWPAPPGDATQLRFVVRDSDGPVPRIDRPLPNDNPFRARRGRHGQVIVQPPVGKPFELRRGQTEPLEHGLALSFQDRRRSTVSGWPSGRGTPGASAGSSFPPPPGAGFGGSRPYQDRGVDDFDDAPTVVPSRNGTPRSDNFDYDGPTQTPAGRSLPSQSDVPPAGGMGRRRSWSRKGSKPSEPAPSSFPMADPAQQPRPSSAHDDFLD